MSTLPQDVREDYYAIRDEVKPINKVFRILTDYSKQKKSVLTRIKGRTLHSMSDATKHDFNITQKERSLLYRMREPKHLEKIIQQDRDTIFSVLHSDDTIENKFERLKAEQDSIFVSIVKAKKTTNVISKEELKELNQKNLSYSIAILILSAGIIQEYDLEDDSDLNLYDLTTDVSQRFQDEASGLDIKLILSHLCAQIIDYIIYQNESKSEPQLLSEVGIPDGILGNAKDKPVTIKKSINECVLEAVGANTVNSQYKTGTVQSFSTYADAAGTIGRTKSVVDETRLLFGMEKTLTVIIAYHIFSVSKEEIKFKAHNVFETNNISIQISIIPASEGGHQLSLSMNDTKVIIPEIIYDLKQPWTKQKICGFFHYYLLMQTYTEPDDIELHILRHIFDYMGIRQGNESPDLAMFQNRSNIGTIILCKATMIISGFLGIPYTYGDPKKGGDAACLLQAMEKILHDPSYTIAINTIDRPLFALTKGLIQYDSNYEPESEEEEEDYFKWSDNMIVTYVYASSITHIESSIPPKKGDHPYYKIGDSVSKTILTPTRKLINEVAKFVRYSTWGSPRKDEDNIIWITDVKSLHTSGSRRPRRTSRDIKKKHILDGVSTDKEDYVPRVLKLFNMLFKSSFVNESEELIIDQTVMIEIYGEKNKIYSFDPSQEWRMLRFLQGDYNLLDILLKYIQDEDVQNYLKTNNVDPEVVEAILSMLE